MKKTNPKIATSDENTQKILEEHITLILRELNKIPANNFVVYVIGANRFSHNASLMNVYVDAYIPPMWFLHKYEPQLDKSKWAKFHIYFTPIVLGSTRRQSPPLQTADYEIFLSSLRTYIKQLER